MSGLFIAFEGPDGSGKTTTASRVANMLRTRGYTVCDVRQPGGTPYAEEIRSTILRIRNDLANEEFHLSTELLMMYAARNQLMEEVVKPALARGEIVITDRHDWSTWAYQNGGNEMPEFKQYSLTPDIYVFLDRDPVLSVQSATERGDLDRYETLSKQQDVYNNYLKIIQTHTDRSIVVPIDASSFDSERFNRGIGSLIATIESTQKSKTQE